VQTHFQTEEMQLLYQQIASYFTLIYLCSFFIQLNYSNLTLAEWPLSLALISSPTSVFSLCSPKLPQNSTHSALCFQLTRSAYYALSSPNSFTTNEFPLGFALLRFAPFPQLTVLSSLFPLGFSAHLHSPSQFHFYILFEASIASGVRARQQHARPTSQSHPISSQIQRFNSQTVWAFELKQSGEAMRTRMSPVQFGWLDWVQPVQLKNWTGSI
jgi:hypothetical protein